MTTIYSGIRQIGRQIVRFTIKRLIKGTKGLLKGCVNSLEKCGLPYDAIFDSRVVSKRNQIVYIAFSSE